MLRSLQNDDDAADMRVSLVDDAADQVRDRDNEIQFTRAEEALIDEKVAEAIAQIRRHINNRQGLLKVKRDYKRKLLRIEILINNLDGSSDASIKLCRYLSTGIPMMLGWLSFQLLIPYINNHHICKYVYHEIGNPTGTTTSNADTITLTIIASIIASNIIAYTSQIATLYFLEALSPAINQYIIRDWKAQEKAGPLTTLMSGMLYIAGLLIGTILMGAPDHEGNPLFSCRLDASGNLPWNNTTIILPEAATTTLSIFVFTKYMFYAMIHAGAMYDSSRRIYCCKTFNKAEERKALRIDQTITHRIWEKAAQEIEGHQFNDDDEDEPTSICSSCVIL